jgi:hypothetical protein
MAYEGRCTLCDGKSILSDRHATADITVTLAHSPLKCELGMITNEFISITSDVVLNTELHFHQHPELGRKITE